MHRDSGRSSTAEGAAAIRALGARHPDPGLRNPDHLAERFIRPGYRAIARLAPARWVALSAVEAWLPGMALFITARTKEFDAILGAELAAGTRQVVVLGAGADSRAYRFDGDEHDGAAYFEVDHPATSAWKQDRLRQALGGVPGHVRYVPVEFHTEKLIDALDRSGVDRTTRTLFLWEGVCMYLEPAAVDATLATVGRFAPGSSIAFDYVYRDAIEDPSRYPGGAHLVGYQRRTAEPMRFGLPPDQIPEFLDRHGFELVSHALAEDLVRRHLVPSDPGRRVDCHAFSGIAHARLPDRP